MKHKYNIVTLLLTVVCSCSIVMATDNNTSDMIAKEKNDIEKKQFFPWLFKSFKITKNGAEIFLAAGNDHFRFELAGPHRPFRERKLDKDKTVFLESGASNFLLINTYSPENRQRGTVSLSISFSYESYEFLCSRNKDLQKIIDRFPDPMTILEYYCLEYRHDVYSKMLYKGYFEKRVGTNTKEWKEYLSEEAYIFPVEKKELDAFLKLVPADKFRTEIYDGFVVLYQIYSGEEAEKRKDFLLHTNGKGNGHWDVLVNARPG